LRSRNSRTERIADFIASALAQFPDSGTLHTINLVHRSTGLDPASQSQVIAKLDALAANPDFADLIGLSYHNLGVGLQDKGAIGPAVAAFRLSLRFLPDRPATLRYLGAAVHQQGDLAGSSAAMERSAQLTPNNPQAQYNAARGLQRLGKPDRAIEYARAALAIQPTADTHLLIGLRLQRLGTRRRRARRLRRSRAPLRRR
jgi:tetratricopeptide (TPR) repeat protein